MRQSSKWPAQLLLVRHGESAGNVARDVAHKANAAWIDISERDMDVGLSPQGETQAAALGQWLRDLGALAPSVALASPYVRAEHTARIALETAALTDVTLSLDERLREREFGILDRLTRRGIEERFPEQAEARRRLGKFYHRPPGGESWCDVALRVRSIVDTIAREFTGERVVIVTHQVVISVFRYVLEDLTEAALLAIDGEAELTNCSVTSFVFDQAEAESGRMRLEYYNQALALERAGAPVTAEPDTHHAPR